MLVGLPLAAPIGLSPLHILTLRGPERVLVLSTEPPDDLSCLTTRSRGWGGGSSTLDGTESDPLRMAHRHIPIHFSQQLIDGLLPLVVASTHASPTLPSHGIDLIDEHDAGRLLLRPCEQITHA